MNTHGRKLTHPQVKIVRVFGGEETQHAVLRSVHLSDGRIVSIARAALGGSWCVRIDWLGAGQSQSRTIVPAIDQEDAAWLATAYVIGAIGGEL